MRRWWRFGWLILAVGGCGLRPPVSLRTTTPTPTQAQWLGEDAPQLVRQLVLDTFDRRDANHDRFLDSTEVAAATLQADDTDHDGRISSMEWAAANPVEALQPKWQLAAADYFAHLDTDHDGWVSRAEVAGLAQIPGFGAPNDVLFLRYCDGHPGIAAKVFTDFLLEDAHDAGRYQPVLIPPAWPGSAPSPAPSASPAIPAPLPTAPALPPIPPFPY